MSHDDANRSWAKADEYVTELNIPTIGTQRARWMYPIQSVLDAGGIIAFGSDWAVTTANPFPQIDLASAIEAFTINAAFVNRLEKDSGSIEVGKLADLIVIDQNLLEIEPQDISDTKVLLTLLEGVVVFGELGTNSP